MIIPPKEPVSKASVVRVVQQQPLIVGMGRIEAPPPYFQATDVTPPPPDRPIHATPAPPNRPVHATPTLPNHPMHATLTPAASHSNLNLYRSKPVNTATNFIFMKTRHEPINGVFSIDPDMKTVALDKTGATAVDRRDYNLKHRQRHRHHGRKSFKKRYDLLDPHAIFETRQGPIALDLSVVAGPQAPHTRTLVQAATRQGSIDINVRCIHPQRGLNLEVYSRKGDILILIPRSFSGYIQTYSRKGQLNFLPSLAHAMTLVSRHEREMQVVVGNAVNCLPARGAEWAGNTIHIASRHGDIFVGYSGEDEKPTEEPGFWKKLASMLQS